MNKELIEEKALLYALGTLPDEEIDEFETLIRRDREVQAIVHGNQLLNELDASEDAEEEPPFHVFSKIMAEVDPVAANAKPARSRSDNRVASFFAWSGWAAAASVAAVVGIGMLGTKESQPPRSDIVLNNLANPSLVAVKTPSEEFGKEDRMLELAGLAEAYWFSREGVPAGQRLADADAEVAELSGGFTIFDRKYNIGFIAVENMPEESDGKSYHVWAKAGAGSEAVRAGALPIGDESRGLFFFDLSTLPNSTPIDAVNFFVTEEKSSDPQKPSQMVVLSDF